jgi:hypothetical protein
MYRKLLISAVCVGAGLLYEPAFAATFSLGSLNPAKFDSVSLPSGVTTGPAGTSFSDDFTFTLTSDGIIFSNANVSGPAGLLPSGFQLSLFSGTPTTGTLVEQDAITITPSGLSAGLDPFTAGAGLYYLQLSGASHAPLAIGGTVAAAFTTAVPEMSTWAMLTAGFASLAFAGASRKRRKPSHHRQALH